jgi:sialate O-acetylesterase
LGRGRLSRLQRLRLVSPHVQVHRRSQPAHLSGARTRGRQRRGLRQRPQGRRLWHLPAWNVDRAYALPPGTLQQGRTNVIAVRVYDGGSGGGIVGDAIGIYSDDFPRPEIDLAGTWKFQAGDDAARSEPGFDDSKFESIPVPSYWESSRGELDGFGWYRKSFHAQPGAEGTTMVLMLGKIDDTDEVYLNGTKVGGTGNLNDSDRHSDVGYYDQNRGYYFPASLLKAENVIAVRVHDHGGRGGIYEGPIGIISQERYADYWEHLRHHRHNGRGLLRLLSRVSIHN